MESNLSMRTRSAASRATSDPPAMAIPTSAARSAGASLTPSPVTATAFPLFFNSVTILSFCSGVVRPNTISSYEHTISQSLFSRRLSWCPSSNRDFKFLPEETMWSSSFSSAVESRYSKMVSSVSGSCSPEKIPTERAMAAPVKPKSPVTMKNRIPARRQSATVRAVSGRAGSNIPKTPMIVRSQRQFSITSSPNALDCRGAVGE
ncbi:hypothetical protein AA313_de0201254 [Arthrobotrys entomopaga]|nr:hypothetical protein AA313_de0201254 [Arthrobotrys entomopaga]